MPWVKLDDHITEHPKFANVGGLGVALYVAGLAYCNRNLTDGHIPRGHMGRLVDLEDRAPVDIAARLVDAGLWVEMSDGWVVHGYLEHQRSAAEIQELSGKRAAAGKQGGTKRAANAKQVASKTQAEEELELEQETPRPNPVVEPPPRTALAVVASSAHADHDPIHEVFVTWQDATHKWRALLDDKRRRCIVKALKTHPLEDVLDAVRGIAIHPHNRGQNERNTEYLDITIALRDAGQLERFRDYYRDGPVAPERRQTRVGGGIATIGEVAAAMERQAGAGLELGT